jgi:hypothetical protein
MRHVQKYSFIMQVFAMLDTKDIFSQYYDYCPKF